MLIETTPEKLISGILCRNYSYKTKHMVHTLPRAYNTIYFFVISILVMLFAYSGMVKYTNHNGFTSAMYNQPFSQALTHVLIYTLPVTELFTAALLVFNITRLAGIVLALVQMILFTGYNVMVLLNYYHAVPCPCGGFIQNLTWHQHLLLNVSLTCLCIIALALHRFILIKDIHGHRESRKPV